MHYPLCLHVGLLRDAEGCSAWESRSAAVDLDDPGVLEELPRRQFSPVGAAWQRIADHCPVTPLGVYACELRRPIAGISASLFQGWWASLREPVGSTHIGGSCFSAARVALHMHMADWARRANDVKSGAPTVSRFIAPVVPST